MGKFTEPKVGPFSIAALVIGVGAIVGIIAVFLNWYEWSASLWIATISDKVTGMGFLDVKTDDFQKYCPLLSWIMMILALILAILPVAGVKAIPEKTGYLVIAILGILALIFVIMFLSWTDHAAIGAYMALVASILVLIGGALPMVEDMM